MSHSLVPIYEIPRIIHPDAKFGESVKSEQLDCLEQLSPLQIQANELTVITSGEGKIAKLNSLGIATAERIRSLDETGWMFVDEDDLFDMPTLSTQYVQILSRKARGVKVNTRFRAGTDTTVFARDNENSILVLDSTGQLDRKLRILEKIKQKDLPFFCIHAWAINDAFNPKLSFYFSMLLKYDFDDVMYQRAIESLEGGSLLPIGINLANDNWQGHLTEAMVGYNLIDLGSSQPIRNVHSIDSQVLPLFANVPRGIDDNALRLMGVHI